MRADVNSEIASEILTFQIVVLCYVTIFYNCAFCSGRAIVSWPKIFIFFPEIRSAKRNSTATLIPQQREIQTLCGCTTSWLATMGCDISRAEGINFGYETVCYDGPSDIPGDGIPNSWWSWHVEWPKKKNSNNHSSTLRSLIVFTPWPNFKFAGIAQDQNL